MGKLFVVEGVDGSGKQTQSNLLVERLKKEGINVKKATYPNYKSESSSLAKMYLRGDFGKDPQDVDPRISSTFYAADRYATYKLEYEEFYNNGGVIVCDRYTTSNMVHQAGKIKDLEERDKFLNWLMDLEYEIYKIPKPNQVFFLDIKPEISVKLVENRKNKFTNEAKKDIHEEDINHLKDSYENANYLIEKYGWERINCIDCEKIRSIEDISDEIYKKIKNYL